MRKSTFINIWHNLHKLWLAAILHDTGKISLSQSLLEKPGPLTKSEWDEIKKHPECGVKIIKQLELDWCEKAIIQHHERPDGKGYPAGGNLTYYNAGDQCCVLGWATQDELDNIRSKTGLDVVWLE